MSSARAEWAPPEREGRGVCESGAELSVMAASRLSGGGAPCGYK